MTPVYTTHALDRLAARGPGADPDAVAARAVGVTAGTVARLGIAVTDPAAEYRCDFATGLVLLCKPSRDGSLWPVVVTVLRTTTPVPLEDSHGAR